MRYLLPWSQFAKNSLISDYGIESDRIIVSPPGIDLSTWKPIEGFAEMQRDSFSVLFVGGDFVRKGGDTLLRVASDEAFRDMEFHFVTKSFSGPTPGNVHVHADISPNSDTLIKLYRNSDVFVLPTKADYAPTNAVIEALSMGVPVITTDVGGLGDLIKNGEHGFVIPIGDCGVLGERLMQLKSSPLLLRRLKMNGRKFSEQNFDINHAGSRIIDLLREVGDSKVKR
jgi:glycosyltransferase involved in cell wall biosynthesis